MALDSLSSPSFLQQQLLWPGLERARSREDRLQGRLPGKTAPRPS